MSTKFNMMAYQQVISVFITRMINNLHSLQSCDHYGTYISLHDRHGNSLVPLNLTDTMPTDSAEFSFDLLGADKCSGIWEVDACRCTTVPSRGQHREAAGI